MSSFFFASSASNDSKLNRKKNEKLAVIDIHSRHSKMKFKDNIGFKL